MENFIGNMSKKGRGYKWAAYTFFMVIFYSLFKFLFAFAHNDVGHHIAQAFMALIGGLVLFVLPVYIIGTLVDKFKKNSEEVSSAQLSTTKIVKPDNTNLTKRDFFKPTSKNEAQNNADLVDKIDNFYAQAWDEINDKNRTRDKALWAKSFTIVQGDEKKAQAKYIELRVEQLIYEQKQREAEEEKKKREQIKEELILEKQRKVVDQYNDYITTLKSTVTTNWLKIVTGDELIKKHRQAQSVYAKINSQDTEFKNTINAMSEEIKKRDVAKNERLELSDKYEDYKDTIISEVKKTLKTQEELQILESQSRLPYAELIKLGSPGQLTDQGLAVYEILIKEINKAFLKKFSFV